MAALKHGASCAHVTVNGIGERAGNTPFEEIVMALEILYGYKTHIKTEEIFPLATLVSRYTGIPLPINKAVVGEMAFTHESGIHAHGVMREPATYESIRPEMVGRKRRMVLGKHSGSASVEAALSEMNYHADEKQLNEIVKRIKRLGDDGKRVTDTDLMAVAEAVLALQCNPFLKLRQFTATSGSHMIPTATVTLMVNGQEMTGAATGDGPVDAAMQVLRKCVADVADIQLEEYHVDAIRGGTDALVDVTVRLSKDGKIITSRGASTDIIMASVEAMIAGMNRLLEERT
jgi:D-citramalate synthase